jgi:hypothetical protein
MELSIGQAVSGNTESDQTKAYIGYWVPEWHQTNEGNTNVQEETAHARNSKTHDIIHPELSLSPNPFSDYTIIDLEVENPSDVTIVIYDSAGRLVEVIFDGRYSGHLRKTWRTHDTNVTSPLMVVCRVNGEVFQKMLIKVE